VSSQPTKSFERRRVVVTGLGAVTPLGNDVKSTWAALLAGRSGVSMITEFSTEKLRSDIAASVKGFDPTVLMSAKEAEIHGRVNHFALAAAVEAMRDAGLDHPRDPEVVTSPETTRLPVDPTRVGCLLSTGQGAVDIFEQQILKSAERGPRSVSPYFIPGVMLNGVSALISMRYGLMGPSYNIASACATGTHSIATSALLIEAGEADIMVAGGAEAATRSNTVAGFGNARALARSLDGSPEKASRPYDKRRQGFVMGEGAGALVLEDEQHARQRGATILGYVAGFGMTTDGEHITRPHADGLGLRLAMTRALARAGIAPEDIGYINPHATSTTHGDVAEYAALHAVFGDRLAQVPVSATKSMLGHLLGAAGAVESIATLLSLREGRIHPSINVDELGEEFVHLRLATEALSIDARYALKCSAGFGGHNCALVFERV
jgi:3-oxoacyl-[acyl-carrier-protein] synthase II